MSGHSTAFIHIQIVTTCFLMMNGMNSNAQTVLDTIKTVHISPDLKSMIHFSGYMQKRSNSLIISDSIKFNGIKTIKQLTVGDLMRLTQVEVDKYNREMEAVYRPLREEQRRINESGVGKGLFHYNPDLGYFDPMKKPIELLNKNEHKEDKYKAMEEKGKEILKKYEPKK